MRWRLVLEIEFLKWPIPSVLRFNQSKTNINQITLPFHPLFHLSFVFCLLLMPSFYHSTIHIFVFFLLSFRLRLFHSFHLRLFFSFFIPYILFHLSLLFFLLSFRFFIFFSFVSFQHCFFFIILISLSFFLSFFYRRFYYLFIILSSFSTKLFFPKFSTLFHYCSFSSNVTEHWPLLNN